MTPLEEIEQAIDYVRACGESTPLRNVELLGPLYTARAIERLEATVRMIGVILQDTAKFKVTTRGWNDPHAYAPYGSDFTASCRCGRSRVDPIHPAEL